MILENEELEKWQKILEQYQPVSNVTFEYIEGGISFKVYDEVDMSDDEAFNYGLEVFGFNQRGITPNKSKRSKIIREARQWKSMENVGGVSVTSRSLAKVEGSIPGVTSRMESETGKIVILGNGLSTLPVEMLDRNMKSSELVIVDMFNYEDFLKDLTNLKKKFELEGVETPSIIQEGYNNCKKIVEAIEKGSLKAVQYVFGDGEVPLEVLNADLAVNSYGPPDSTIAEQISLLRSGGELYLEDRDPSNISESYISPIINDMGTRVASVIKKK